MVCYGVQEWALIPSFRVRCVRFYTVSYSCMTSQTRRAEPFCKLMHGRPLSSFLRMSCARDLALLRGRPTPGHSRHQSERGNIYTTFNADRCAGSPERRVLRSSHSGACAAASSSDDPCPETCGGRLPTHPKHCSTYRHFSTGDSAQQQPTRGPRIRRSWR